MEKARLRLLVPLEEKLGVDSCDTNGNSTEVSEVSNLSQPNTVEQTRQGEEDNMSHANTDSQSSAQSSGQEDHREELSQSFARNERKRSHDAIIENDKDCASDSDSDSQSIIDDRTDFRYSPKRQNSSVQSPHREYHCPSSHNTDFHLPVVHAVITCRRYSHNGIQRYRLQKLFLDGDDATNYAAEWTWGKYSKFEDNAKRDDLDVLEEGIGFYTPGEWNEAKGMDFRAFVQQRFLE